MRLLPIFSTARLKNLHKCTDAPEWWSKVMDDCPCDACLKAKSTRSSYQGTLPNDDGLACYDIWETSVPSVQGERYVIGMWLPNRRFVKVYRLKAKSESPQAMDLFEQLLAAYGVKVTWWHTDGAKELSQSQSIKDRCRRNKQRLTTTNREKSRQNPMERQWRTLREGTSAALIHAKCVSNRKLLGFWSYAMDDTVDAMNMMPWPDDPTMCGYKALTGHEPKATQRRPWGCLSYVHLDGVDAPGGNKQVPRAEPGIMLGRNDYSTQQIGHTCQAGYLVFCPSLGDSGKVLQSVDVDCVVGHFPGLRCSDRGGYVLDQPIFHGPSSNGKPGVVAAPAIVDAADVHKIAPEFDMQRSIEGSRQRTAAAMPSDRPPSPPTRNHIQQSNEEEHGEDEDEVEEPTPPPKLKAWQRNLPDSPLALRMPPRLARPQHSLKEPPDEVMLCVGNESASKVRQWREGHEPFDTEDLDERKELAADIAASALDGSISYSDVRLLEDAVMAAAGTNPDILSASQMHRLMNDEAWTRSRMREYAAIERAELKDNVAADDPRIAGVEVLDTMMVGRIKRNEDGTVADLKSRLVAMDFGGNTTSFDENERNAPTARMPTYRVFEAMSCLREMEDTDFDFDAAYLQARQALKKSGKVIVVRPPPEAREVDERGVETLWLSECAAVRLRASR